MIKSLRKRARPDNLKNQVRAGGQSFARRLYLYSVVGLLVLLGWTFTGHLFFLDAEGIVTKERTVIAPDYVARVASVHVKPGDRVEKGQHIATLQSREVQDSIAELTTRRAQLTTRESQIVARMVTIRDIVPIAEERARRSRELLAKLDTVNSSEQTADYSQRRASAMARKAQIASALQTIAQTTASSERRLAAAKQTLVKLDDLFKRQLTTAPRIAEAQREFYDAERQAASQRNEVDALRAEERSLDASLQELEQALTQSRMIASAPRQAESQRETYESQRELTSLRTESAALQEELDNLQKSLAEVSTAMEQVQGSYNGGKVIAHVDGTVGARVPNAGHVVKSGEPLVDIYRGSMFVLAYMPTARLYGMNPDDYVSVSDGQRSFPGRIERIENVTDTLPPEFQQTFRAQDRQQIFRITLDGTPPFAIQAKVKISGNWSPVGVVRRISSTVTGVGQTVTSWLKPTSPANAANR